MTMIILGAVIAICFVIFTCLACFYAGFKIKDIKGNVIYKTENLEGKKEKEEKKTPIQKQVNNFMGYKGKKKGGVLNE